MGKNLHSHYGRGVSGSNLIIHGIAEREITAPDTCLLPLFFFPKTFYAQYEISSVASAIFSLLKVSYFSFYVTQVCVLGILHSPNHASLLPLHLLM